MKILHIAEKITGGGAESVFAETIKSLNDIFSDEIENQIACISPNSDKIKIDLDFGLPPGSKLGIVLSQIYSGKNYRLLNEYLKDNHPDIIHVQNYGNLSPSVLRALWNYKKKRPQIPIIHTAHTFELACSHFAGYDYRRKSICLDCSSRTYKFKIFYRGCSRAGWLHSWGKGVASLIANRYIKRGLFNQIITPSVFLKKVIEERKSKLCDINVLRNPLTKELTDNDSPNNLLSKNSVNKEVLIVYFGRFSAEKNIGCLIKAFNIFHRQNNNSQLLLIGDGDERPELVDEVISLGLEKSVVFRQFMPKDELYTVLNKAHIAVLPSKCLESASLLVPEAVMNNLIPVVANHGGMKEMVEWVGIGRTFASDDENDLVRVLHEIVNNYNTYTNRLTEARLKCKKLLNSKHYAYELHKIYNDVQNG